MTQSNSTLLNVKYFEDFKAGPKLVISGGQENYQKAGQILTKLQECYLDDPRFAIYYPTSYFPGGEYLYIDKEECAKLSEIFLYFGTYGSRAHDYSESKALDKFNDLTEILISCREYGNKIFTEDD